MVIYNLTGKHDIWWQEIKRVKKLKERYLTWRVFKKYFKRKFYLNNILKKELKSFTNKN